MFEDTKAHLSNEVEVAGRVLPSLPGAIWSELSNDWATNRGQLVKNVALSAGVGTVAGILFSRSPALAKVAFGAIGLYQGWGLACSTGQMLSSAWEAGSQADQEAVARNISASLGRAGANFAETMPATIAGGIGGTYIGRQTPFIQNTLFSLEKQVRMAEPESLHYVGPDSQRLNIASTPGKFDLLSLSERMAQSQVWPNLEEGRFFQVSPQGQARIGRALPGTASETFMGRQSDHVFHTHLERIAPTSGDYFAARKVGVISVPRRGLTVFYEGLGDRLAEVRASVNSGAGVPENLNFRFLVLDRSKQLAVGVESMWSDHAGLEPVGLQPLHYRDTLKALSAWDGGPLKLAAIKGAPQALLSPGMTDLMRQLTIEASKGS